MDFRVKPKDRIYKSQECHQWGNVPQFEPATLYVGLRLDRKLMPYFCLTIYSFSVQMFRKQAQRLEKMSKFVVTIHFVLSESTNKNGHFFIFFPIFVFTILLALLLFTKFTTSFQQFRHLMVQSEKIRLFSAIQDFIRLSPKAKSISKC